LIRYYPKSINLEQEYKLIKEFKKNASEFENHRHERFQVIREACGNGYVSFSISTIIIIVRVLLNYLTIEKYFLQDIYSKIILLIVIILLIYFLRKMHFIHVHRQHIYTKCIISDDMIENEKSVGKIDDE